MEQGSNPNLNQDQPEKHLWADLAEVDEEDLEFLIPPKQVIGPDENGIKKVIEYKFNEEKKNVKITTTIRTRKLSKRAAERRSWSKFGDAVHDGAGSRLTVVSTEEIFFERTMPPGTKSEDPKVAGGGDPQAQPKMGGVLIVCRTCGKKGDHWTSRCPYKDLAPESSLPPDTTALAYVPPGKRAGAKRPQNDDYGVRIFHLSQDTREPDLRELFAPFGAISRVHVVVDQETGICRGLGFVHFVNREDGQRAIDRLDGYGYDNLILRVSWARLID